MNESVSSHCCCDIFIQKILKGEEPTELNVQLCQILKHPTFLHNAVTPALHIHEQIYKVYTRSHCINYSSGIQIAL